MIGTQNPPEDVSRKSLSSGLLQRVVVIETPDYTIEEVIEIVGSKFKLPQLNHSEQIEISRRIVDCFPYEGKGSNNFNKFKNP